MLKSIVKKKSLILGHLKHWVKKSKHQDGVLEYDSLKGWMYVVKGQENCNVVRLPFTQKKEALEILNET